LEEALKMKGTAASKTNRLMDVNETVSSTGVPELSLWQKFKLLFGKN
jgi:hypothetical protein